MSMIERIFRGNYHPCETIKPDSDEFRLAEATAFELAQQLEDTLTDKQKAMFEAFLNNHAVSTEFYALEYYRHGVILGSALIAELLGQEIPMMTDKGVPH